MAGEWLKFDASTPDKPEVLAITVAMGWDDPDLTVGKLLRVWRWFDQQTIDGNAPGVTSALLDRLLGVTGLCEAMAKVGWLVITDDGISLPNFDRHNGKTAKDRALTAKRVANHKTNAKGNGKGNAVSVSDALPREEKKRINKTPLPPSGESGWAKPDWVPADLWSQFEEVRRRKKKPMTDAARKLAVGRLERLCAEGHDVAAMLNDSILHAWDTFYAPKGEPPAVANHWEHAI